MILYLFTIILTLAPPIYGNAEPTKLCFNDDCSEKLFTALATRNYIPTHQDFIKFKENDTITVFAIKMSNRPDFAEGMNSEGERGLFYINQIDHESYFFFLFSVVKSNAQMSEVLQSTIPGVPKLVKKRPANPYLWRDYKIRGEELGMKIDVEMLDDPDVKKPHNHHHHHHHGHDHSHDHHGHDHHDHSHEQDHNKPKEIPKVEEAKPQIVEQKPTPLNIDPLKKISLDAMKGIHKDIPKPEATLPPQPNIADIPNPIINENNIVEPHHHDSKIAPVVEKAAELKEEVKKIAPEMLNSIIDAVEQIASSPHHELKIDTHQDQKIEEIKQDNIPISDNLPVTPQPVVEIPQTQVPNIEVNSLKEDVPQMDQFTTTTPSPHIDALPTTPASVEIPTILPPKLFEEQNVPVDIPTPAPVFDLPFTTTPTPAAAELPTIITPPVEIPTPNPFEIPTTNPEPIPFELPLTTPPPLEEPTTPISMEIPPPTITPASVNEIPKTDASTTAAPETYNEPSSGPAISVLQDEAVRERRALEKDEDYCYKNDCSGIEINSTGFVSTTIRPVIKSFSSGFRSFMPYPLSDFDDTGAFVFVFFVVSFFVYIISWVFSDSGRPDVLDRRALHDALTKIKEQEVQIEQLRKNASDPAVVAQYGKEIERLRKEKIDIENRFNAMGQAIHQRERELQEAHVELTRLQNENHKLATEKAELQNKYDNVFIENKDIAQELNLARSQLSEANSRQSSSVIELQESRKQIDELESEVHELQTKYSSLEIELDNFNTKCEQLEGQNETLQDHDKEYISLIGDLQAKIKELESKTSKNLAKDVIEGSGSGESNASNGWSDLDAPDFENTEEAKEKSVEVEAPKQKPITKPRVATLGKKNKASKSIEEPIQESGRNVSITEKSRSSNIDIYEVVNLKSELRKVEAEREDLKRELANEQKNREAAEQNLDNLKKTLNEKKSDLEIVTKDKDYFRTLSETANQKVEEYTQKIERLQEEREKIFALEKEVLVITSEKNEANLRIKELEKAVRKAEELSGKLETRYFHEERKFKDQIFKLEDQLAKVKLSTASIENAGSGNSSDRDFLVTNRNNIDVPSLWSDLEGPETSFDDSPRESRRRSIREQQQQPMETGRRSAGRREGQSSSTHRRYRSRSAGRQRQSGAPSPYLAGVGGGFPPPHHGSSSRASPTNYYDDRGELRRSGRLSRSGQQIGYYSSDGSGPLSPPPNLPAKSGVPPPAVLLHRPAPK